MAQRPRPRRRGRTTSKSVSSSKSALQYSSGSLISPCEDRTLSAERPPLPAPPAAAQGGRCCPCRQFGPGRCAGSASLSRACWFQTTSAPSPRPHRQTRDYFLLVCYFTCPPHLRPDSRGPGSGGRRGAWHLPLVCSDALSLFHVDRKRRILLRSNCFNPSGRQNTFLRAP